MYKQNSICLIIVMHIAPIDVLYHRPPGAPALVFHRDFPYFMFTPEDVMTVWIALDDMDEELGPLEYVRGSHKWGDGRVGSASSFFHDANKRLLYSAARLEGIEFPESSLDIVSMAGLKAGGVSIHNGKVWHGSGKNVSNNRPRRGVGLHFIPGEAKFTAKARDSRLWRSHVPENVNDEDIEQIELSDEDFPLVYSGNYNSELQI
jgi:phytanoyl-CoA hydroxylase